MMLQTLNKLSGSVAAAILYPIKSAILNTLVIFATFVVAAMLIIGLPILVAIKAYNTYQEDKLAFAIWSALVIGVITTFVGIPLAIILISVEVLAAIGDLTNNFIAGIIEGYKEGLFFHVINRFLYNYVGFSSFLTGIIEFVEGLVNSSEEEDLRALDEEAYQKLKQVRQQQEVEDFTLLSEEELAAAQGKNELKAILDNYIDLNARLTKLDEAIARRENKLKAKNDKQEKIKEEDSFLYANDDGDVIEDELKRMEIIKPILVVKMFEDSPGQWKTVSGTTKIGDNDSLKAWITEEKNCYPLTREPMDNAIRHDGKNTKYVLVDYNSKKDANELVEAAKFIRKGLNKREISLREAGSTTILHLNQMLFRDGQNDTTEKGVEPSSSSEYRPT